MLSPTVNGVRINFDSRGTGMTLACRVLQTRNHPHPHPLGALTRVQAFHGVVAFHPNTFYVCVGERDSRMDCLNFPNAAHRAARGTFPVHFLRPTLTQRDAVRNATPDVGYGTSCGHKFDTEGPCDCVLARMAAAARLGFSRVVIYMYDVYSDDVNPISIDAWFVQAATCGLTPSLVVAAQRFELLNGTAFGGELEYKVLPNPPRVTASVAGNGERYEDHPLMSWLHRPLPNGLSIAKSAYATLGPNEEITLIKFVPMIGGRRPGPADDDIMPQIWHTTVVTLANKVAGAPVRDTTTPYVLRCCREALLGVGAKPPIIAIEDLPLYQQELFDAVFDEAALMSERMTEAVERHIPLLQAHSSLVSQWSSVSRAAVWRIVGMTVLATILALSLLLQNQFALTTQAYYILLVGAVTFGLLVAQDVRRLIRRYPNVVWAFVGLSLILVAQGREVPWDEPCPLDSQDRNSKFLTYHDPSPDAARPLHKSATVTYQEQACNDKCPTQFFGMTVSDSWPVFSARCQCNEVRSIMTRACGDRAPPSPGWWDRAVNTAAGVSDTVVSTVWPMPNLAGVATDAIDRALDTTPRQLFKRIAGDVDTLFEKWVNREHISAKKREALTIAYESLKNIPLNARDLRREVFVKIEAVSKRVAGVVSDYDPRTIMGMSDRLQAAIGPYFYELGRKMKMCYGLHTPYLHAVGKTGDEIGLWYYAWSLSLASDFGGRRAASRVVRVEADASRFDKTLDRSVFLARVRELRARGVPSIARRAYLEKISKVGQTRHGVFFRVDGTRASGDADTSDDNTDINKTYWFEVLSDMGLHPGVDFALACAGDDVILLLREESLTGNPEQDLNDPGSGLLWKIKYDVPAHNFTFLSALFVPNRLGVFVLVPKPGRVLSRTGFSRQPLTDPAAHMKAIALGLHKVSRGVPILRNIVDAYLRCSGDVKPAKGVVNPFQLDVISQQDYGVEALEFFTKRYGITYAELLLAEDSLDRVDTMPCVLDDPVLKTIAAIDLA